MSTSRTPARRRAARGPEAGARGGASEASALGKNVANSSRTDPGARRADRYELRRRLWKLSSLPGVRKCGRVSRTGAGGPTLRVSGGDGQRVAGYAGLVSCGAMSCPCCAARIGARRVEEITQVVDRVHAEGGTVALVTLTARHHAGHRLAEVWDAITTGWARITSGREYAEELQRFGVTGWCAVVETTHGEASWHPHRHALVFFDGPISREMVEALVARQGNRGRDAGWFERWRRGLIRAGCPAATDRGRDHRCRYTGPERCSSPFEPVEHRGGLDVQIVDRGDGGSLGTYLSKVAHEVSGLPTKVGRAGSRTPWQLLRDALENHAEAYDPRDLDLWFEYEQTARRRRTITWSQGTRERYEVRVQSDEEIVAEELSGAHDDLIALPAPTWRAIRQESDTLLTVAEQDGPEGAALWLSRRGLPWSWANASPGRGRPPRALRIAQDRAEARRVLCPTS